MLLIFGELECIISELPSNNREPEQHTFGGEPVSSGIRVITSNDMSE